MLLQIKAKEEALTNKDNHKSDYKSDYKKLLEKIAKEKLGKIEELTSEIDYNDLIYYFKNNTSSKDLKMVQNFKIE